jgi:hypothetical protein
MKQNLIIFFTLISISCFSQKNTKESFLFNNQKIEYTRIDYSKYGITQMFITMYEKNAENHAMITNSVDCLESTKNLYHTLYFFLEIPSDLKGEKLKSELFSKFVSHLNNTEKVDQNDLYLNFDFDYSIPYRMKNDNAQRTVTNITPGKICRALTIN